MLDGVPNLKEGCHVMKGNYDFLTPTEKNIGVIRDMVKDGYDTLDIFSFIGLSELDCDTARKILMDAGLKN